MAQLSIIDGPIIRAGESLSEIADCRAGRPVRIVMPELWTPAYISFQVSVDGIHFDDLYGSDGKEIMLVCDGGKRAVVISPEAAIAVAYVKYRSGPAWRPVPQAEERLFLTVLDSTITTR